jgi:hypothetical protein
MSSTHSLFEVEVITASITRSYATKQLCDPCSPERNARLLLVDPVVGGRGPRVETLGEPELDLLLSVLDSVGTVADVPTDLQGVGASDRTGVRLEGVGGTEHDSAGPRRI